MAETDAQLAARLAGAAGRLLIKLRDGGTLAGKALGAAGDAAANRLLVEALRAMRPGDALLSEEEKDNSARLAASRVWIIDPLDGTREYGEGRSDWAVHVALAVDGTPVTGAVALPGLGKVLRSDAPVAVPPAPGVLRMVVSRSRPAPEADAVAARLGAQLVPMGSAGAKAMAVILGEADIYLHTGGQHEWDSCAPAAVALAHGLHVSQIDGAPLVYNRADTYMPDLLICRKEHAAPVFAALAGCVPPA
jgi:3'(2'), 5'-bisphosphate nucleotidase